MSSWLSVRTEPLQVGTQGPHPACPYLSTRIYIIVPGTVPLKSPCPCCHTGGGKTVPSKRSHVVALEEKEKVGGTRKASWMIMGYLRTW